MKRRRLFLPRIAKYWISSRDSFGCVASNALATGYEGYGMGSYGAGTGSDVGLGCMLVSDTPLLRGSPDCDVRADSDRRLDRPVRNLFGEISGDVKNVFRPKIQVCGAV